MDEQKKNYESVIKKLSGSYNQAVVQSSINQNSLKIIEESIANSKRSVESIVAAFEEIRATSSSTVDFTDKINSSMISYLENTDSMKGTVSQRVDELKTADEQVSAIDKIFDKLKKDSSDISSITSKIEEVAERTNILSINASIEAARIGQDGAGFRVIAQEVKKLSEMTGNFAQDISVTINSFSSVIDGINNQMKSFVEIFNSMKKDMENFQEVFADNSEIGKTVGNNLTSINSSIKEQSFAIEEGLNEMTNALDFLKDTYSVSNALISTQKTLENLLKRM